MNRLDKISRNIRTDYIFTFLKNFDISSAIWVLYMVYRGLPLWQVGVGEGIFHAASFIFEIPSGAIADIFGRKKTIIAGRICMIISCIINLFAHDLFSFSIGFIISALGYNLNTGSEEALVYDSLKAIGREEEYLKVNSRLNIIIEVSQSISIFVGGVIAEQSFEGCYIVAIIVAIISLIPAFILKEVEFSDNNVKTEKITFRRHFETVYKILKNSKELRNILLYYSIIFTFNTVVYFYGQEYFSTLGYNKIYISIIMLISGAGGCLGSIASVPIMKIFGNKAKYIISVVMGISIIILSFDNVITAILAFIIINFVNSVLYPIQSSTLNKLIPSEQRATLISVDSMLFSLFMVILFPLCGFVADVFDLHVVFLGVGILQIIFMVSLLHYNKRSNLI